MGSPEWTPSAPDRRLPGFREWMCGLPHGWTDVGISKTARIRLTGNLVCPPVVPLAWEVLWDRMDER